MVCASGAGAVAAANGAAQPGITFALETPRAPPGRQGLAFALGKTATSEAPRERRASSPFRRSSTPERKRMSMLAKVSRLSLRNRRSQPNEHGITFKSSSAHLGDADTLVVVAVDFGTARTG